MGKATPLTRLCLGLIILLALINLLAVFGPELGFDALWYHLTLPKLFLMQNRWYYPGGLLYYSAMPRLAETLFIPMLKLFGTTGPKFLQFASGLLTTYYLYQIARRFFDQLKSALACLLFYGTWLVSWQSSSAYVDLIRTLFEVIALYFALNKRYVLTGIALGLAIGVKWQALISLLLFSLFFSPSVFLPAIFVSTPWFFLAWHFTGNPLYPLFEKFNFLTQLQQVPANFFYPLPMLSRFLTLPYHLAFPYDDQLNPLIAPLFLLGAFQIIKHANKQRIKLLLFSLSSLVVWQLIPPPSSRYLLPYLPAIAIIAITSLDFKRLKPWLILGIISMSVSVLFVRTWINAKYLPYLLGQQTQNEFLTINNAKLPGTVIDTDNWIQQNIPQSSRIIINSWHNLYYFPLNFDHVTWAPPDRKYDYLVTQYADPKLVNGILLHTNSIGVQVFKLQ